MFTTLKQNQDSGAQFSFDPSDPLKMKQTISAFPKSGVKETRKDVFSIESLSNPTQKSAFDIAGVSLLDRFSQKVDPLQNTTHIPIRYWCSIS